MRKSFRCALLAGLVLPAVLSAQKSNSDDSVPNIAALRAPSAPAFVLLGISPSDVARPQTPSDLAVGLITKASVSGAPNDVAIEVSPYWLVGHQQLTWRDDIQRSLGNSISRTFGLSFATTQNGTSASPRTGLGIGARTMLLSGHLSDTTVKLLEAVEASLAVQGHIYNKYEKTEIERINALVAVEVRPCLLVKDDAEQEKCVRAVTSKYQPMRDSALAAVLANKEFQREIAAAEKTLDNFALTREGLFWELAGGSVWNFADGVWSSGKRGVAGAWTTLSYEGGKLGDATTWTPIIVGRVLRNDSTGTQTLYDAGGRIVMSSPQYALSAEWVHRFSSSENVPKAQNRVSGMLEYKISDDLWLFGAMGKDYASATKNSLISKFGVSLSFKKQRYKPKE